MKVKIGIVGYGNLGKATECEVLKNSRYKLVAIFSRRLVSSKFGTTIEPYENYLLYKNKIDVMLLCGSSKNDLEPQTKELAQHFDCINTFDNHSKILSHLQSLEKITTTSRHRAIVSCGWDPGLFSIIRALFYSATNQSPHTFWGKGMSLGHSDAIRRVAGVDDGVQFTIPNNEAIKLARQNKLTSSTPKHFRECFVTTTSQDKSKIENDIKNIPNYFKGQPVSVKFVSPQELLKLKSNTSHQGQIVSKSFDEECLEFKVKMKSNPIFTAKIMTRYIESISHLKEKGSCGAFTPLDIPVSYLFENRELLITKFC